MNQTLIIFDRLGMSSRRDVMEDSAQTLGNDWITHYGAWPARSSRWAKLMPASDGEGVSRVFAPPLVAALSGTSVRQLRYWRKTDLLAPEYWARNQVLYSFQDLLALRTFGFLRERSSLQQIRTAVQNLRGLGLSEHLANYHLYSSGGTIVLVDARDDATDLVRKPGQRLLATMDDVLGSFQSRAGQRIVPLASPARGVEIDEGVRGGYPVIRGTRVPFDAVASLMQDGVPAARIVDYYPSVTAGAARGALKLAEYVEDYARATAA